MVGRPTGSRMSGRYRLLRLIGQGGTGQVWLAYDRQMRAEVALKRLSAPVLRVAPDALHREFALLARLRHPAIVGVYDLGFAPSGAPYYTMEFVPGVAANRAFADLTWPILCHVGIRVAEGLEALHGAGIIHGDIKPSNVLVVPAPGQDLHSVDVRIVDFGFAGTLDAERERHRGTPGFAAPELVQGEQPSVATDLYALGALFLALGGRGSPSEPTADITADAARRLEGAGLPAALVQVILQLLAPRASERPRSAREVREVLVTLLPAARRPLDERIATETFVGRHAELLRVEQWLARSDGPTMLLLTGEMGIGKSALLRAVRARLGLAGRPSISLSCTQLDGSSESSALTRPADSAVDDNTASREPMLATLVPTLQQLVHQDADVQPMRVILLDDVDQCDEATRVQLRRMALMPELAECRWIMAGHGSGIGWDPADQVLVESGRASTLRLGPLDAAGVKQIADERLSQPAPAELVDWLWQSTNGHPGLVVEMLRHAVAGGCVRETDAGLVADAQRLVSTPTANSLEQILAARWNDSPMAARRVVAALAVLAQPATSADVASVLGEPEPSTRRDLMAAAPLGLMEATGERWALAPATIAGAIEERLEPTERRRLHEAALHLTGLSDARRFRHLAGADQSDQALALAQTLTLAGNSFLIPAAVRLASAYPRQSAAWSLRLGLWELEREHHAAAIEHLERALGTTEVDTDRARCLTALTRAYLRAGTPAQVADTVATMLRTSPSPEVRAHVLQQDAMGRGNAGDLTAGLALARQAVSIAHEAGAPEVYGLTLLTLGSLLVMAGCPEDAATQAAQATEAFTTAGDHAGLARAAGLRAVVAQARGDRAVAARAYEDAIEMARRHDLRMALEELLTSRGALEVEVGRWEEARASFAEAARIALADGRRRGAAIALTNLSQLDGLTGRVRPARRGAWAALRLSRTYLPRIVPMVWRSLAQAYRIGGQLSDAAQAIRRALTLAQREAFAHEIHWGRIEYGRVCIARQRWRQAEQAWQTPVSAPVTGIAPLVLTVLRARAALRRSDLRLPILEPDLTSLDEADLPYARAHVLQLRAEMAIAGGDSDTATRLVREALTAFDVLPAPADRTAAALEFAVLAIHHGALDRQQVSDLLAEAARGYQRLGDHQGRERAMVAAIGWHARDRRLEVGRRTDRGLLDAVSRMLDSLSDMRELAQRAMRDLVDQVDAERGVLLLLEGGEDPMPIVELGAVDSETRNRAIRYSRRVVERVAASGKPMLIRDAPSDEDVYSGSVRELGLRSILCVPMFASGAVIGAVYVDDTRRPQAFGAEDRGLLEGFASLMAIALVKSRGQEQLVVENLELRREVGTRFHAANCVGSSLAMQRVLAVVERAALVPSTVLLTGENGTGKELVARLLHHAGRRRQKPFVAVNCGAITDTLLESELFGILNNVATGVRARTGKFVQANGGTLFLDEVGDMPANQQVALLSAIASREITPVGGGRPIPVDIRIIAATNRDLRQLVHAGQFREDLFYRLNVIPIHIPPLREHKADIPALARHFATELSRQQGRSVPTLSKDFIATIMQCDWPGNVRELQNYVESVLAMTPGDVLFPQPLPSDVENRRPRIRARGRALSEVLRDVEEQLVREALERCAGNQSRAARELGLSEATFRNRLARLGLRNHRQPVRIRKKLRARRK